MADNSTILYQTSVIIEKLMNSLSMLDNKNKQIFGFIQDLNEKVNALNGGTIDPEQVQQAIDNAQQALDELNGKVDKVDGKDLSTNDYTDDDKSKLNGLPSTITYPVTSVNSKTGDVALTKTDIGLGNVSNTADADKPVSAAQQTAINTAQSTAATNAENWVKTYGVGTNETQRLTQGSNLNTQTTGGFFDVQSAVNCPSDLASQFMKLVVIPSGDTSYTTQLAFSMTNDTLGLMYIRECKSGTWSGWRTFTFTTAVTDQDMNTHSLNNVKDINISGNINPVSTLGLNGDVNMGYHALSNVKSVQTDKLTSSGSSIDFDNKSLTGVANITDTGWQTISLSSCATGSTARWRCQTIFGVKHVTVECHLIPTATAYYGNVPTGYRPNVDIDISVSDKTDSWKWSSFQLNADGSIQSWHFDDAWTFGTNALSYVFQYTI